MAVDQTQIKSEENPVFRHLEETFEVVRNFDWVCESLHNLIAGLNKVDEISLASVAVKVKKPGLGYETIKFSTHILRELKARGFKRDQKDQDVVP